MAAWRLYAASMQALNQERHRLLLQLQEAAAAEDGANAPSLVGQPNATLGQVGQAGAAAAAAAAAGPGGSNEPGGSTGLGGPGSSGPGGAASLGMIAAGASVAGSGAVLAASAAAVPAGAPASSSAVNRRTGTAALDVAFVYTDLLDAVERNLLRGRAVVMMFGWSMLCMLSAEQIGLICVHSWPYFPLIRAVAGYMLGKDDLVP